MTAPEPDRKRPGLREQMRRTRAAAMALATAHLELLKAELAGIGAEIKWIAALVGGIVALLLFALSLLAIGGVLFLGEWLFGSIGWGILHGLLLSIGGIVAMALLILDVPRILVTRSLLWALVSGASVSVGLGLNLAREAATRGADFVIANVVANLDPAWAPAVVAGVAVGVVLGIVGVGGRSARRRPQGCGRTGPRPRRRGAGRRLPRGRDLRGAGGRGAWRDGRRGCVVGADGCRGGALGHRPRGALREAVAP